jgi:hypothetical protein
LVRTNIEQDWPRQRIARNYPAPSMSQAPVGQSLGLSMVTASQDTNSCTGYLWHPFQNKRGKSCVENLVRDVDKEEKIGVVVIITSLLENRYAK